MLKIPEPIRIKLCRDLPSSHFSLNKTMIDIEMNNFHRYIEKLTDNCSASYEESKRTPSTSCAENVCDFAVQERKNILNLVKLCHSKIHLLAQKIFCSQKPFLL